MPAKYCNFNEVIIPIFTPQNKVCCYTCTSLLQFPSLSKIVVLRLLTITTQLLSSIIILSLSVLVERLSSVQREREKALAAQLRVALNEKEEALRRVQQLEGW